MNTRNLMNAALGIELPELVLKNAKIINVFTKFIEEGDIAIHEGMIVGIGSYKGKQEIDLLGRFVSPGFIDGHCHIESSMSTPANYALLVMPQGTTSVVADCHEIANVKGVKGIDFMLKSAKTSPLDVFMMIPSCVPSTKFETSGAKIRAEDIAPYKNDFFVKGLGEMMDYPGVLSGDKEVHKKIAIMDDLTVDGHCPSLTGHKLNAYVAAGIKTDHESTTPEEMIEKIKRGMYVHLREGSQTKNVLDLMPGVTERYVDRLMFCSDDLHPKDIMEFGHINNNINIAIDYGLNPISAIQMATINIANCYGLKRLGAIAPGYFADLVVFSNLNHIKPEEVYKKGKLVAKNGKPLFKAIKSDYENVIDTVNIDIENINLDFKLKSEKVNVIGLMKNNVTTKKLIEKVKLKNGLFHAKDNPGLLKLVVIERHKLTGNIGKALLRGYGLSNGAIALTIAHDSHNLIVVGDNDSDMMKAIKKIKEIQGGIVLVSQGEVVNYLPLRIGGLMSTDNPIFVRDKLINLEDKAREMGVLDEIDDPFMGLGFLSLPVIPDLKCTDMGLFDVKEFKLIPIEVNE